MSYNLGFIGGGNMSTAIVKGIVNTGTLVYCVEFGTDSLIWQVQHLGIWFPDKLRSMWYPKTSLYYFLLNRYVDILHFILLL